MGRYETVCEMKIAAIAIVALAASGFAGAQESAKGTFQSQSITFDIGGAIAFNATSSLNKNERASVSGVSNRRSVPKLDDYVDRRRAIDTLVKNNKTA